MEANWIFKSLENLERNDWGNPNHESGLVTSVYRLRKVPLNQFESEDLRIMIGQNIGLKYLIPMAIEMLKLNPFIEGDFYEGDLLQSVLNVEPNFWETNSQHWLEINNLINENIDEIDSHKIKYVNFQELKIK